MIIDASVAIKWLTPEENSDVAAGIADREDLYAPYLLMAETANALCKKVRRGEIEADVVPLQLADLPNLLELVDESSNAPRGAQIALELGHSAYDCIYLALAEARGEQLLSADARFLAKVTGTPFETLVIDLSGLTA